MNQDLPEFDVLLQLAQEAPQELERLRLQLAHSTISSAPKQLQKRLHGLQFQIDAKRTLAKTPLLACMQISEMMHQSFEQLRLILNKPIKDQHPPAAQQTVASATIYALPTH